MSESPLFVAPEPETPPEPEDWQAAPSWDERRMTLIQHLEELRRVLIISLIAWVAGSIIGLVLSGVVIDLLIRPLQYLNQPLHYFGVMGYFTIHLKVGLMVGLVLALPVVLHQVWTFVAPGLKPKERRYAGPLLLSSLVLFALGGALAYFFLYIVVRIIGAVSHDSSLVFFPEAGAYIGFVVVLMLAFGITFEFPVALVLGAMIGVVKSSWLRAHRPHAIFTICAVGYIVTPGVDPITPLALIIPLLLLFEVSIGVIRIMGK
jgi:sec-independent protein translocase protein TatC